jgi:hydroxypyruvate reductase
MMEARSVIDSMLRAALAAVEPAALVRAALDAGGAAGTIWGERGDDPGADGTAFETGFKRRVWVVGAGKAARAMSVGAADALGDMIAGGSVTVPRGSGFRPPLFEVWEGGHPLPEMGSVAGAADALRVARMASRGDTLLCLLSGGASALWAAPPDGVTLDGLREVTGALLRSGAPIGDVNTVRRHLTRIGGGWLARAAAPADVITLVLSDVIGGGPHDVGSGPTSPDPTSFADALAVFARWEIVAPATVRRHLQAGAADEMARAAASGDHAGAKRASDLSHLPPPIVVGSVRDALAAAAEAASGLGYAPLVVSDGLAGEARAAGRSVVAAALEARAGDAVPRALLWGGETTVAVTGAGKGGRNQELALAAALELEDVDGISVATFATDGVDGPTDAAGAVVDRHTAGRARAAGVDPRAALDRNDSHAALEAAGALLRSGPNGTNVNDLTIALVD